MNTMKLAISAALLTISAAAFAQSAPMAPQDFANMAASSDMFEITSSQLAIEKGVTGELKAFAEQMIGDHTKASAELKAVAEPAGVKVPAEMLEKHAAMLKALQGEEGDKFAAAYVDAQVAAHKEAVALMTTYAESGDNEALKGHAAKAQPVVTMHLEHVQTLDK